MTWNEIMLVAAVAYLVWDRERGRMPQRRRR